MKVMIVGDLHGDWGSLNNLINKKQPDLVLQCGDFGYWPALECSRPVLYGRQTPWKLRGLKTHDTMVYWCDGNHEDHWHLRDHPREINYGKVLYKERGSTCMLPDGRTVMFIGGADSIDKDSRTLGVDWFPEEVIGARDFDYAMGFNDTVDIVISHTCPLEFDMKGSEGKINDPSRVALSRILKKYKPDLWYFGHWHKHQKGQHLNTHWTCLDYPKHSSKWWEWLV